MAVKLHPDQNKDDPNANEKFQELGSFFKFLPSLRSISTVVKMIKAWCNEVLTDDKKKKLYDKCGKKCVDEAEQDGAQGGGYVFLLGSFTISRIIEVRLVAVSEVCLATFLVLATRKKNTEKVTWSLFHSWLLWRNFTTVLLSICYEQK